MALNIIKNKKKGKVVKNVMTILLLVLVVVSCSSKKKKQMVVEKVSTSSGPQLLWEISGEGIIDTPESAYYDPKSQILFLTQISGAPDKKDGKGWIVTADANGKVLDQAWMTGLNAPKGMRAHNGVLWVSDINQILAIEIATKKLLHKYTINSANFLNDVAISDNGDVYVSDMGNHSIYALKHGKVSLFTRGVELESPNGMVIQGDHLILATWGTGMAKDFTTKVPGHLYSLDLKTKKKTAITADPLGNLDGLEVKTGDDHTYLVSDFMAGKVYEVVDSTSVKTLLEGFKGAADIGFIKESNTLIVPRMMENKVSAYKL